jgi:hypothetical protein
MVGISIKGYTPTKDFRTDYIMPQQAKPQQNAETGTLPIHLVAVEELSEKSLENSDLLYSYQHGA